MSASTLLRSAARPDDGLRHDWTRAEVRALIDLPFPDLLFRAQTVHRQNFDPCAVQMSALLSIKTGGCPEDCAYCPQSVHHDCSVEATRLMRVEAVLEQARAARDGGATRFCMGAAWRAPKDRDLDEICAMVDGVKALGLETCMTLGMLTRAQAVRLKDAGLDYYNHNLDTSPEHYGRIITTRTYQDRLDTLEHVREAGMHVCCGGIVGLGEDADDQAGLLVALATLVQHPESVPINLLVRVAGTRLAEQDGVDPITFVRIIAAARIMMPRSFVRLAAGREDISDETHALCFLAGVNSIFYGARLLTAANAPASRDAALLDRLGMAAMRR
jgi:biotin synthase